MRADRLIALMLMLYTKGRCTAQELAEQLEVSERTIYRDLDALSTAGIPVYAQSGPNGGVYLDENFVYH
jgi:predicted DNA-binding transcriptional regulator YafY